MNIIVDIGHPAHVHYFKNFIRIMSDRGHQVLIISRDKEVTFQLLDHLGLSYVSRGQGNTGILGKLNYMLKASLLIYRQSKKFKPDLFISFGSIYAALAARMYGKPHIAFDDTEHAKLDLMLYPPLTRCVLTPETFRKDLGRKHIRFNGFMELCYLHPNHFSPDINVLKLLGVEKDERYAVVRFVSWKARHDKGQAGIDRQSKLDLVRFLLDRMKVFISSEEDLPSDLSSYRIEIPPHLLHDALAFSSIYIGEGATTASEAAVLGIPSIYVNSLTAGTLEEQEKRGLLYSFRNSDGVQSKLYEILEDLDRKKDYRFLASQMIEEMIDVSAFMVWFIESFPISFKTLKTNPSFQDAFIGKADAYI